MESLAKLFHLLLDHIWKFFLLMFSTSFFLFVLFPLGDLSDLISSQVSKLTQNQLYLQFADLRFSLLPKSGVALENVYIEAQGLPPLKAEELVMTPSLMSLITQKPAGTVTASGFLNGNVEISLSPGQKSDNGVERQKIVLNAKTLSLNELRQITQLPFLLKGNLSASSTALIDLTFHEQPDVDINLKIDRFELPSSNVQTVMGPLTLPELKLSSVEIKGRLSGGRLLIENGVIGKGNDELRGTIKGSIALRLENRGRGLVPVLGSYDFDIDLTVQKSFQERAGLFLTFIDNHKSVTPEGARYRFKVAAQSLQYPPNVTTLR